MRTIDGISICEGIAIGRLFIYRKNGLNVKRKTVADTALEKSRYKLAKEKALLQLDGIWNKAKAHAGEKNAALFDTHRMILEDEAFESFVENLIETQSVNAEFAVAVTGKHFAEIFTAMGDEYQCARAADVRDISERLIHILTQEDTVTSGNVVDALNEYIGEEPVILVTDSISPSELVSLPREKLLAAVTCQGSYYSHAAILARSMDIPAITGIEIEAEWDKKTAVLDGHAGTLTISPSNELLLKIEKRRQEEKKAWELLRQLKGKADVTRDGTALDLYANIGSVRDVDEVIEKDAKGIGLFRSEFLYLEAKDYPDEEMQFQVYKTVAVRMNGKRSVIRTFDIGADKQVEYLKLEHEENPALGFRGVRVCLERQDMFRTQLRAILRAGAYGNLAVMYPMIISVDEVRRIKAIVESVKAELEEEKIPYGNIEQGIMIETPAAVMVSDMLAKEVDFFSIGTNDLTQYVLAIDRQNRKLDNIYDAHHPAVLKMIEMTVENAHKHGCHVGICGELGADITLIRTWLEMGVDELSVPPASVLPLRKMIREMDLREV